MWQYLYFMVYLNQKSDDEYTGQESYVSLKLGQQDVSFFPLNKSMDLPEYGGVQAAAADGREAEPGPGNPTTPLLPQSPPAPLELPRCDTMPQDALRKHASVFQRHSAYPPSLESPDPGDKTQLNEMIQLLVSKTEKLDQALELVSAQLATKTDQAMAQEMRSHMEKLGQALETAVQQQEVCVVYGALSVRVCALPALLSVLQKGA